MLAMQIIHKMENDKNKKPKAIELSKSEKAL